MFGYISVAIVIVISFICSFFFTKSWIAVAKKIKLEGRDINKKSGEMVAEAGGISFVLAFSFSTLILVFLGTFYFNIGTRALAIFALLSSVLIAGLLGFVDDILGWKVGLRQLNKFLLTIPIALPPMVINAGVSAMDLPFFGHVEFGIIYPLLIIPIGVIGATNGFNLLAGMNSLEGGMGAIILVVLGIVALISGSTWVAMVSFIAVAALLGFLCFNKYPSKIFPGDTLTYSVGALIALVAILGNIEKIAVILFIPYIIEFLLKARSRFKAECFGVPQADGTLKPMYEKSYSITQAIMRYCPRLFGRNLREYEVVGVIFVIELVLAGVAFVV